MKSISTLFHEEKRNCCDQVYAVLKNSQTPAGAQEEVEKIITNSFRGLYGKWYRAQLNFICGTDLDEQ